MNNNYNQSNKSGKSWLGIILVGIGLSLLSNMGLVPNFGELIGAFWPMIIIFVALMFHVGFTQTRIV